MLLQAAGIAIRDVIPLQGRRSLQLSAGASVLCSSGRLKLRLPPLWLAETCIPQIIHLEEGECWQCEEAHWLLIEACCTSSSFVVQAAAGGPSIWARLYDYCLSLFRRVQPATTQGPASLPLVTGDQTAQMRRNDR